MRKRILAATIAFGILCTLPVQAQTIDELRDDVQRAVCLHGWDAALSAVGRMIGNSGISSEYRDSLLRYRRQIQAWQGSITAFDAAEMAECAPYLVEETDSSEPVVIQPSTLDWNRAVSSIESGAGDYSEQSGGTSSCDPSYPSLCIPVGSADLDCGDISAQGFRVLSPDPHGFDGDGDGIGCE